MTTHSKLLEELAEQEHDQWVSWTKGLLVWMREEAHRNDISDKSAALYRVADVLQRKWEPMWVPYEHLTQELKDSDRGYAKRPLEAFQEHVLEVMGLKLTS